LYVLGVIKKYTCDLWPVTPALYPLNPRHPDPQSGALRLVRHNYVINNRITF